MIKRVAPWVIALIMMLSIIYVEFKYDDKKEDKVVTETIYKKDTLISYDTVTKVIKGRAVVTQLPPDTVIKNDTVFIHPKAFTASMDTILYSEYNFKGGSCVTIKDHYNITFRHPIDSFFIKSRQEVDYNEIENTITKFVTSDKWYNKPEYTIPLGFVAGALGTAGIVYMVK